VEGTLDRVERATQFTAFEVRAWLRVPAGTDEARSRSLLEKAERTCFITNSLKGKTHLVANVEVAG
jgi:organic hydroperoxide reductase OsmC/OhrA